MAVARCESWDNLKRTKIKRKCLSITSECPGGAAMSMDRMDLSFGL